MQYFRTKKYCVAVNSKVGSNSFCEAYVRETEPHTAKEIDDADLGDNDYSFRSRVEQVSEPDAPVLLLVRDPIERFISGVSMNKFSITPDEVIESLRNGGEWSKHPIYQRQSDFVDDAKAHGQPITVFKFPEQIKDFCKVVGIKSLPVRNENKGKAVTLTSVQTAFLRGYYKDDERL